MTGLAAAPPTGIANIIPFRRSPDATEPIAARVTGRLPDWLKGDLVRTCPAVFAEPGWRADHWFDGLALLYAFQVNGASDVSFRSRLLDSELARGAAQGKARLSTFGTSVVRSFWQRLFEPVPRITDNTNVNVLRMGDDLVAMTESDRQIIIDEPTLAAKGVVAYSDTLSKAFTTAHPHFDFERGRVLNVATTVGAAVVLSIYEHGPTERSRRVVGSFRSDRLPYVHSFGLTPKHAILVAHPFTTAPFRMLWSNRGYADHLVWRPEQGTRLVVIERATGKVSQHLTDPFFVFHTVNAFERDGETVLDLLGYPNADIVESLRVERMQQRLPDLRPAFLRVRIAPGQERARTEKLSDRGFEFPAINYRHKSGHDYGYAWGASDGPGPNGYESAIVRVDVRTGASLAYEDGRHIFGEPVFVSRPGSSEEDDGVLLSVGSSRDDDSALLAVVDARSMTLVASAEVPRAIPLGFHGSFVRAPS